MSHSTHPFWLLFPPMSHKLSITVAPDKTDCRPPAPPQSSQIMGSNMLGNPRSYRVSRGVPFHYPFKLVGKRYPLPWRRIRAAGERTI